MRWEGGDGKLFASEQAFSSVCVVLSVHVRRSRKLKEPAALLLRFFIDVNSTKQLVFFFDLGLFLRRFRLLRRICG